MNDLSLITEKEVILSPENDPATVLIKVDKNIITIN